MTSETLDVAICQLTSVDDLKINVDSILSLLEPLEPHPPQLVCLPENCLYMRVREGQSIPAIALDNLELRRLLNWSRATGAVLHLGSVAVSCPNADDAEQKLYNSTLILRPDGSIEDAYRKIHLFDVDVTGHRRVRESDFFARGERPTLFEVGGWTIGNTICYDLRFAELYSVYAKAQVDAVVVPSAFLVPTGQAHWHVLLRARAIESQFYVLAAAQGGEHGSSDGAGRQTYGHSLVVGPWGEILQEVSAEDMAAGRRVLRLQLSRDRLRSVRAQIPMADHRCMTAFSLQ